ncbi:MAG TPA: outer membrane protein assembly factor BamD [Myxococcota bacterium]|nr:outer membrane protein assembly factor BamD [Myxococcota bacterium]
MAGLIAARIAPPVTESETPRPVARSSRIALAALALALAAGAGCSSAPPAFQAVPPAEELYADALEILEGQSWLVFRTVDYTRAIEKLQAIIDNYPYSDVAVLAELKIADAYFDDRRYDEALSYYRDFADLHPQHEKVPYTILQAARCRERQMRSANRDQTATRDALQHLDRLLAQYPHSPEASEGEVLWRELRTLLANNVTQIAEYYMEQQEYESAAERFRSLLNEYPGLGLDDKALYNLGVCYREMRRDDEAERIFQSIVQNYRDSDYAAAAADRIAEGPKRN